MECIVVKVDPTGGHEHHAPMPAWARQARKLCAGCHDDFYNGRPNCDGKTWCWSMKPAYARRKTRPPCFH